MRFPVVDGQETVDPAIAQQAAVWMARLWADDATDAERSACARWRAAHPHHELAWHRLQAFDDKLHSVPGGIARHALREPAPQAYVNRRRAMQVVALTAVVGGTAWVARGTEAWQAALAGHRTGTGEVREVVLPDGSQVVLASGAALDVRFDAHERLLVLHAGEVLVTTSPDPAVVARPLRVRSPQGTVEALGTRFTVRLHPDRAQVQVFEGAVDVRPVHAHGAPVRLRAGQGASFSADSVAAAVPATESATAWTRGVLVADDMRLDEVLAEIGRYRAGLLRCDPRVAGLRVSGVFPLRDTDRALHNLVLALPVAVVLRTRYWVTVQPAAG
ncbi:iron dicitrate transport regulator FecR [Comamonas serinivorans]|uniref:Iron dicitrate transport regulator FecR n=1 Tax=Comamonas serinivorans TaxID=1082851 RepID=A0A1Y0ET13_9BURK|nr:FecR domain-containing protein [Comamonas serinivorans]ARU06733.1 iron dicitrate transport regulator FecR [Comamonas serinivorans]